MAEWKSRTEYWADVGPRIKGFLENQRRADVVSALEKCLEFFSYNSEDLSKRATANTAIVPKLDLFVVYAHDQIRAAPILYSNFNLAPAAIAARATFENCVSQRYIIKNADSAKLADQYNRFKDIEKIRGHRNSPFLSPLSDAEESKILDKNPEWRDADTGKLVKKPHWTGKSGTTFEQLVQAVDMKDYYSLYRTTSAFVHASPITLNLYVSGRGLGSISTEIQARRMCLLIAMFALETLVDYCKFFGVTYDAKDYYEITCELNRLTS